jgi:hypothetical protein
MAGIGANRGPKLKTVGNTAPGVAGFIRTPMEPTSKLNAAGRAKFKRLVATLSSNGTLARVDPGVVTEAARVKAALDEIYAAGDIRTDLKATTTLTSQRRGLFRELGLTLQPSRSAVKSVPGSGTGGAFGEWQSRNGG